MKYIKLEPFGVEIRLTKNTLPHAHKLKELLLTHSLVVIKDYNIEMSDNELIDFSESLSFQKGSLKEKVLHWDFGPIMQMKSQERPKNYLFSEEKVPFHWDGAFFKEAQFLVFLCEQSKGIGGETLFTNTEAIWHELTEAEKKIYRNIELEYRTEKKAHYGGVSRKTLVQEHPLTQKTILRFAEQVDSLLNPVDLSIFGSSKGSEIYESLCEKIYSKKFCYKHCWQEKDLVLVDNFSNIHARTALGNNTRRSFKRVQVL